MKHILTLAALVFATSCFGQVPDYVPSDGLVAWYGFEGNADDGSGNEKHGTPHGVTLTSDRFGAEASAYHFPDAFPTYIQLPEIDENIGDPGVATSLSLWSRSDQTTPNGVMMHCQNNPNEHVVGRIEEINDGHRVKIYHRCPAQNNEPVSAESFNAGAWNHFVIVMDGQQGIYKLFVNGVLWESMSFSYDPENDYSSFPRTWEIGTITWNGAHQWAGDIDDIGIFERALTEVEVFALYNAVSPITGCIDEQACNFNPEANVDDDSCTYPPFGLTDCEAGGALCGEGTAWDEVSQSCVVANVSDTDFDGCVGINDFLIHLSNFGSGCGPELTWSCGDQLEYQGYHYETVQIGEQCWFAENLRSENYENGDVIPTNLSNAEWQSSISGAMAVYGDGSLSLSEHGGLYNWYAVDDARGLCPTGWHVPSDEEWNILTDHLGGESEAGVRMKTTYGWHEAGNGSNESNFSGLPGGLRGNDGSYAGADYVGRWYSSTQDGPVAWNRDLIWDIDGVDRNSSSHTGGFSIRCIKDPE